MTSPALAASLRRHLASVRTAAAGWRPAFRIANFGANLGASLWPRACLLCEQGCGADPLCVACSLALPGADSARCPVCAAPSSASASGHCPDCQRLRPVLAATWTAADYCSPLAEAITALKFGRQLGLASGLGLLLARSLAHQAERRAEGLQAAPGTALPLPSPRVDCLVPIPLAAARLADRGFNQAESIARALARHWPATLSPLPPPLRPELLSRPRDTARQSSLGGPARLGNVDAGFTATPAKNSAESPAESPAQGPAQGLAVGLVDDVMTTGATLDAAARALLGAGARSVVAFVVARTP